jgi:hypothetical protein
MKDADGCLVFSTKRRKLTSSLDGLTASVEPPTAESAGKVEEELLALESEIAERLGAQAEYIKRTLLEVRSGDGMVFPIKPNATRPENPDTLDRHCSGM